MKYYVIADLHGRYDLLLKAQEAILEDAKTDDLPYKIITLGDYIDRGPRSKDVIDYLMSASQYPDVICLKGNHEDILVQSITKPLMPGWWVGNGGDTTLQSYGWGGAPFSIYAYDVVIKSHIEWMQNLPLYFETEKQVFVHAGIPQSNMNLPPSSKQLHKKSRIEEQMMWMLYDKREAGGWKGKHVVHGHHQFADGPHTWSGKDGGRTDLDCYAYHTGRLVIGVFDDTQGPAKKFLEVLGGDYGNKRERIGPGH